MNNLCLSVDHADSDNHGTGIDSSVSEIKDDDDDECERGGPFDRYY